MKSLRKDDWEKEAKRLAVGQTSRIYHGAERRPNLVIRNLADRYTAYCHSCHEGSVIMKDVVRVTDNVPAPTMVHRSSPGLTQEYASWDVGLQLDIVRFLISKDVSLAMLKHTIMPSYSISDNRLVFTTPDQVVGRDLTGQSHSKWYTYTSVNSFNRAAHKDFAGKQVWLTEDYFSALKGQYYANRLNKQDILFVSLMGTVLHPELTVELCKASEVIILLDHDDAGLEAAPDIHRSLRMLNVPTLDCTKAVAKGCDPKNMKTEWWSFILG